MTSEAILPITVSGWVSLFLAVAASVSIVLGGGKLLQRIKNLEDFKQDNEAILEQIKIMKFALFGLDGDNGMRSDLKALEEIVRGISNRNNIEDAISARERGAAAVGREDRHSLRRMEDRILHGDKDKEDRK